jgi:hypothetical protein
MMKSILMSTAMFVLAAGTSLAQFTVTRVEIPFDFAVGSAKLPAGEYIVDTHIAPGVVALRATDGRGAASAQVNHTVANKPADESKLVFNKYGNRYFLSQVWEAGKAGHMINRSRREMETAKAETVPAEERILFAKSR